VGGMGVGEGKGECQRRRCIISKTHGRRSMKKNMVGKKKKEQYGER